MSGIGETLIIVGIFIFVMAREWYKLAYDQN